MMAQQPRVITFDVDSHTLFSLTLAFPDWPIQAICGATTSTLVLDWKPETAALLVVGVHHQPADTLGLCRGLRSQPGRSHTPLFVLVKTSQEALVTATLRVGADSCLLVPVHSRDLVNRLKRVCASNQPGRHALSLDQPPWADPWRDAGGEG